jgi:hypothetical protein
MLSPWVTLTLVCPRTRLMSDTVTCPDPAAMPGTAPNRSAVIGARCDGGDPVDRGCEVTAVCVVPVNTNAHLARHEMVLAPPADSSSGGAT